MSTTDPFTDPSITRQDFLLAYFETRPGQELRAQDVGRWADPAYERLTGNKIDDADRQIRMLHAEGLLHRTRWGHYVYYPDAVRKRLPPPFTEAQKAEIYERDGRVCAVCGSTEEVGYPLEVDHIKTRSKGGESVIENGQVLCNRHNYMKKNYGHTETAKRFFRNLYRYAVSIDDQPLIAFIQDIMEVYERHGINDHIHWDPENP